jgi:hypothetical protein
VAWRRYASRLVNAIRERTTQVKITDQGSMFRGYARAVVDAVNQCTEYNTFVPALAYTFSMSPTEIRVAHEERGAGKSKYSLFSLMRLNFDLMTGFSTAPMRLFSGIGIAIALLSVLFVLYLLVRRYVVGPEAEGVFTLFAIAFFLLGVALFGVGLLGEYVGRIYDEVRQRPRYIVGTVLERREDQRREERAMSPPRAVVFAYHDVGVRCLRTLLAHGVEVPLVFTHLRRAGREHLVRQRRAPRALAWHRGAHAGEIPMSRTWSNRCARCGPISCSRSTTARCSAASCCRCRRAGPTTCMAHCCQSIAAGYR